MDVQSFCRRVRPLSSVLSRLSSPRPLSAVRCLLSSPRLLLALACVVCAAFSSEAAGAREEARPKSLFADGAFRGFDPFRFPEVYDSVTRADVEAFLRESIVEERSALSILIPKKEGASQ